MEQKTKRKYSKRFYSQKIDKSFIADQLRKEWDALKKAEKRDRILREVKSGAAAAAKILLAIAAAAGAVTIIALGPNAVGAIAKSWDRKGFFEKRSFQAASSRLKRMKYAEIIEVGEGEYKLTITDKGLEKVARRVINGFSIPKPRIWDGRWRIAIFDIPNRHKAEREIFREKLRSLGFYKLQESVFVFPYPCERELDFLVSMLSINSYVNFMEVSRIADDIGIKEYFDLR